MMKIRLIYFGLILISFSFHTDAQHFVCNSLDGYNTKDLTNAYQWQVTTDSNCMVNPAVNCTFYMSFCQPASMCFGEYSACQNSTGASNVTVIGGYTSTLFFENETGPRGFYAKFPKGPMQNISNASRCEPSLTIKFNCNLHAQWFAPLTNATASAPKPTNIDIIANQCLTIMTFDYSGACYHNKEPEKGITGGAVFLIILLVSIFVYLVGGMAYNGLIQHRSGINLIPNARFWTSLLLDFLGGVKVICPCCFSSSTPSKATYESV